MPLTIEQVLTQVARRELSVEAACTQLEALAAASPDPVTRLIARVQTEIAIGRLAHDAGRKLIAALESAGDRTAMFGSQTKMHPDATIIRPADGDQTVRKPVAPDDATFVQTAPGDATEIRPLLNEPTMRTAPPRSETVIRDVPHGGETTQHFPRGEATVRHQPQDMTLRGVRLEHEATIRQQQDMTLRGVKPEHDPTLRVPKGDDTLRAPKSEDTLRAPKGEDTLRAPKAEATLRAPKPGDATLRGVTHDPDATVHTLKHDPDATVLTQPGAPDTVASTRAYDTSARGHEPAFPETLKADGPRFPGYADSDSQDERPRGQLRPGSVIKKRFILDTMLGKGGMGVVFAAIDRRKEEAQDPNPRVALKILNADFARHPQAFIALQREARKAQTLAHPNVVTVFDFDRDSDLVYMTMEMLTGRTLDSIVREGGGAGVKREVALPIIRGIAEGLAYAHRKGFVHSDLKPGNVFIVEDGTPKILDFGIARAIPNAQSEASKDIFDAGMLGAYTEPYATDEMVAGVDPHPADDLYALGIIAYEMLTGAHPYQRQSAPNARKAGLKLAPIKGLKMREARAIERCLSLDRKNRPKDAGEFLKLFRGITPLQKASIAAAAVLAVVAGYFWYENYKAINPELPFDALPLETQQGFKEDIAQAEEATRLFEEGNTFLINDILTYYIAAYEKHPRNKIARDGLDKVATLQLDTAPDAEERRRRAQNMLDRLRAHYETNDDVMDAAR